MSFYFVLDHIVLKIKRLKSLVGSLSGRFDWIEKLGFSLFSVKDTKQDFIKIMVNRAAVSHFNVPLNYITLFHFVLLKLLDDNYFNGINIMMMAWCQHKREPLWIRDLYERSSLALLLSSTWWNLFNQYLGIFCLLFRQPNLTLLNKKKRQKGGVSEISDF